MSLSPPHTRLLNKCKIIWVCVYTTRDLPLVAVNLAICGKPGHGAVAQHLGHSSRVSEQDVHSTCPHANGTTVCFPHNTSRQTQHSYAPAQRLACSLAIDVRVMMATCLRRMLRPFFPERPRSRPLPVRVSLSHRGTRTACHARCKRLQTEGLPCPSCPS